MEDWIIDFTLSKRLPLKINPKTDLSLIMEGVLRGFEVVFEGDDHHTGECRAMELDGSGIFRSPDGEVESPGYGWGEGDGTGWGNGKGFSFESTFEEYWVYGAGRSFGMGDGVVGSCSCSPTHNWGPSSFRDILPLSQPFEEEMGMGCL